MGKAQSKLSSDEIAELQKNTYCECPRRHSCGITLLGVKIADQCVLVDKKVCRAFPIHPSLAIWSW